MCCYFHEKKNIYSNLISQVFYDLYVLIIVSNTNDDYELDLSH